MDNGLSYSSKRLYNDIKKIYKKNDKTKNKISIETVKLNRDFSLADDFKLSSFNDWLSEISDLTEYIYIQIIRYKNNTIKFYTKTKNLFATIDKERVEDIISIIVILNEFFNRERGQNVTILPSEYKKEFNRIKGEVLGPKNCNSGYTIFDNEKSIYLIRKEEMTKVLIHEMLHANECEKYFFSKKFNNLFRNNRLLVFESYVEFLALILNIIFYMLKRGIEFPSFKELLNKERFYCTIKMKQILDYYDIKNINSLVIDKALPQRTAVLEYYILKTIMLFEYEKFFKLVNPNLKIKEENLKDQVEIYLQDIFRILSSSDLQYIMDKIDNNTIEKYLQKYKIDKNSLRMTSITI